MLEHSHKYLDLFISSGGHTVLIFGAEIQTYSWLSIPWDNSVLHILFPSTLPQLDFSEDPWKDGEDGVYE